MYQKDVDCFPCTASLLCVVTSEVPLPAASAGLRHSVKNHNARTTRLHVLIIVLLQFRILRSENYFLTPFLLPCCVSFGYGLIWCRKGGGRSGSSFAAAVAASTRCTSGNAYVPSYWIPHITAVRHVVSERRRSHAEGIVRPIQGQAPVGGSSSGVSPASPASPAFYLTKGVSHRHTPIEQVSLLVFSTLLRFWTDALTSVREARHGVNPQRSAPVSHLSTMRSTNLRFII